MINFDKVKNRPATFKSLTGLSVSEFQILKVKFEKAWDEYVYETYINGKKRKRAYGGGRKPELKTIEDKLLFILFYFKIYPIQEVSGFLFGMSQPQANEWIHTLTVVLNRALGYEKHLPERNPKKLEEVLRECAGLEFMIDATERRINRPKDNEKQKLNYSGKKKTHTKKNNIITDAPTSKIKYLSKTYEGKKHDKRICDDEKHKFPPGSKLYQDTGYQGYKPKGVITYQPKKKPKGGKLTPEEKERNREISSKRIKVEHVIGSVKIYRIVKDIYRNRKENYEDLVMETSCGLHNFKVEYRKAS